MLNNMPKIIGIAFFSIPALSQAQRVHLQNVHIVNQGGSVVQGEVYYVGSRYALCSKDSYIIKRNSDWTAPSRGVCPVTKITVRFIDTDGSAKDGVPFKAKASLSSEFKLVKMDDGNVKVEKK